MRRRNRYADPASATYTSKLDRKPGALNVGLVYRLTSDVTAIPLKDATEQDVHESLDSIADSLKPGSTLPQVMLERWSLALANQYPDCLWLVRDNQGFAGWVGWAPYTETPHTWQTTTYFAPRLRGTGLLTPSRCLQVHTQDTLRTWHNQPELTFVSSIATWNTRSIAATSRYALEHNWPNQWTPAYEKSLKRHAWVLTWPSAPAHTCTSSHSQRQTLTATPTKADTRQ